LLPSGDPLVIAEAGDAEMSAARTTAAMRKRRIRAS
jgi:hypothetical protein